MLDLPIPHHDGDCHGAADAALDMYSRVVADVAERVGPAVVRVVAQGPGRRDNAGSGVVVAGDGLVLANSHVVGGWWTTSSRPTRRLIAGSGRMVGINTAMIGGAQGLCFAVSSNTALFAVAEFVRHGRVQRAHRGIFGQTVPLPRRVADRQPGCDAGRRDRGWGRRPHSDARCRQDRARRI